MGKKKTRAKKISKGGHSNVSKSTLALMPRDPYQKLMDIHNAWLKGKNPWVTVATQVPGQALKRIKANQLKGRPGAGPATSEADSTL